MKNVGIFLFDEVEVLDFAGPFEAFSVVGQREGSGDFNVFTIGEKKQIIKTVNGLRIMPDYDFSNKDLPKIDLLVVPGGKGTRQVVRAKKQMTWIEETAACAEYVMSVCSGALVLAKLGLLYQAKATTHHSCFDSLQKIDASILIDHKARYTDNGKVLTAAGVSAGIDLSFYLIEKILGYEKAKEAANYIEYPYQQ